MQLNASVVFVVSIATTLNARIMQPAYFFAASFDGNGSGISSSQRAFVSSILSPAAADKSNAGSAVQKSRDKLYEAWNLLRATPTGRKLINLAQENKVEISLEPGDAWLQYLLGPNKIVMGSQFVERYRPEQLSYMLAHELEHARQNGILGRMSYYPMEMELGALSVQVRVWVELGSPLDQGQWSAGKAWLKDHVLWIRYPHAVYYAWWLRAYPGTQLTLEDAARLGENQHDVNRVQAYWKQLLREENSWRRHWSQRLPHYCEATVLEAFQGVMESSLAASHLGDRHPEIAVGNYSPWLPGLIDRLPFMSAGEDWELPTSPGPKDLQLLSYLGYEVGIYQLMAGGWRVRKGVENTIALNDLKGQLRILVHNHPYFYQLDSVGKAPSRRDFYDDDADLLFLSTYEGLIQYKMPEYIRDPTTGQSFNPRREQYKVFSDRIFNEEGPPYSGSRVQTLIRDPILFYQQMGMDIRVTPWSQAAFP